MQQLASDGTGDAGRIAREHLSAGGARIRARLALHAAQALGRCAPEAIAIAAACELLHNASLVHDDLQDRDPIRRGQPAIWRKHGAAVAICVGDLLLSAAYAALADVGYRTGRLLERTHRRVGTVIRGQCADLALQGKAGTGLSLYEQVAAGKSGPLLGLPLELALILADADGALDTAVEAASQFAVGYQIVDDLEDRERDSLNEELNIVAVLAAAGEPDPVAAARAMAARRFVQAHACATRLPAGAGALLARYAAARVAALAAATAARLAPA